VERRTIVGTGPIEDCAVEILKDFGEIVIAPDNREESLLPLLDDAVALIVRGDGRASSRLIAAAPRLRVIGRSGAGYENVDVHAATERGIPVIYTPGANAAAVAESALTYMLALCKRLAYWDRELKAGRWESRYGRPGGDLEGSVLGIIGFGSIGRKLAELVRPFAMQVLAYDPYVPAGIAADYDARLVSLDELAEKADFISLHTVLTSETAGLVNEDFLKKVKAGVYLINLSRGGVIENLDILYNALRNGIVGGIGLDVFDPEPPDTAHPIFSHPSVLCSPHALSMTAGALRAVFTRMAEDMAAYLRGELPCSVVNPDVL
jgi:phosphoglycerate dehydrogenase-like enzyme